ncbi:MAG: sulfatase family protein [Planctomycetota bacterium]|jgi:arylsulfatase A-like enzyme
MDGEITRRQFLKYSALGTIGAAFSAVQGCSSFSPQNKHQKHPHIVMYLSDDHGKDFVGCYGNKDVRTPNIDALAREGMLFTNTFAASPTCAPSRSVLWTGLYPAHNGCMQNHSSCWSDITALPTYLRQVGYRVVLAHKHHAKPAEVFNFEYIEAKLSRNPGHRRKYRREGLNTKDIDKFLAEHAKEQPETPLCLIIGDSSPHVTWEPNKIYDPAKLQLPPFIVDTKLTRKAMANYYQDITTMDKRVGEVRTMLKKYGFEDNTLFIYTSDQGSEWPHSKWTLYDAGIHVPFIAVWPGVIKRGSVCDAMISFIDMTPTFIDIAGSKRPQGLDGNSFLDVLLGKTKSFRDWVYATHTGDGNMNVFPQRCVRNTRYKYILNLHPERIWTTHFTKVPGIDESHKQVWDTWVEKAKSDREAAKIVDINENHPLEELYDTQTDPYELNNIAGRSEAGPILLRMRDELRKWLAGQRESMPESLA